MTIPISGEHQGLRHVRVTSGFSQQNPVAMTALQSTARTGQEAV